MNRILFFIGSIILVSCSGPSFMEQNIAGSITSDIEDLGDGAIKATVSSNSASDQVIELLDSTSDLNGSTVTISPGALVIGTSIFVEEAETVLSDTFLSDLDTDGQTSIEEASSSILVEPEDQINPVGSLIISLPFSSSISLSENVYAIAYRVFDYNDGKYYKGFIPSADIGFDDESAQFETSLFGSFQLIKLSHALTKKEKIESTIKPKSKRSIKTLSSFSISMPELSYDQDRKLTVRVFSVSDSSQLKSCRILFDNDKKFPPFYSAQWSGDGSLSYTPPTSIEGNIYVAGECKLKDQRIIKGPWNSGDYVPPNGSLVLNPLAPLTLTNENRYPLSGKCSFDAEHVFLTGTVTDVTTCRNKAFSFNIDLTSISIGDNINLILDHSHPDVRDPSTVTKSFVKPDLLAITPPPNPISLTATDGSGPNENGVESNLSWASGGGNTVSYIVKSKPGNTPPSSCDDPTASTYPVGGTSKLLIGLNQAHSYSIRLCAVNSANLKSSGVTKVINLKSWQLKIVTLSSSQNVDLSFDKASGVVIDWGDGSIDQGINLPSTGQIKNHVYTNPGTYILKIRVWRKR